MGNKYRASLAHLSGVNTFPQVFINGEFYGGAVSATSSNANCAIYQARFEFEMSCVVLRAHHSCIFSPFVCLLVFIFIG